MADIKISELSAALTVGDSDVLPMTASGTTVKVSTSLLKEHAIGDNDISALGDGSVTGAILNVKSTSETADSNIAETMAQNGAHNLCPFPYEDGTSVYSGITITVNNDGTMTGSGTPNDSGAFFFYKGTLAKKSYKICFDGSFSGASIKLKVYDATAGQTLTELSSGNTVDDFTIDSTNATHTIWIYFNWNNEVEAVTISGGFVLLVTTDPSTTYAPHAMTNRELTEHAVKWFTATLTTGSNKTVDASSVLPNDFHRLVSAYPIGGAGNILRQFDDSNVMWTTEEDSTSIWQFLYI